MPVTIGTKIGPYEVRAPLGQGGMGVVFRAHDTRLGRDVAVKVLPDAFATDPDRLSRFQREALLLASLNHPAIAHIYGLEESGKTRCIVMELVEGETLADRLKRGPLPIDEALETAKQIAEALEAAHDRGILHRDLKPGNIMLAAEGKVKVLDFGLAKVFSDETLSPALSNSPTMMSGGSVPGMILGTPAYMSPEQARGRPLDKRCDIWAFGVILFEMLTGRPTYGGETLTDILGAIVHKEPDWAQLSAKTPTPAVRLLRRCLAKDSRQRLHDIADARIEIEALRHAPETESTVTAQPAASSNRLRLWIAAAGLVVLAIGVFLGGAADRWTQSAITSGPQTTQPLLRATIELPADAPLAIGSFVPTVGYNSPAVALSPDGAYLSYVGEFGSGTRLYLRDMASGEVRPLEGTEGAIVSFFSPDGGWLGFLTNDRVKKVPVGGGAAITLSEATLPVLGWWLPGDVIYFTEIETFQLSRVSASAAGTRTAVLDSARLAVTPFTMSFTDVLPDGRSVLATTLGGIGSDHAEIVLIDIATLEVKPLVQGGYGARFAVPGHLVYARSGSLMAVPFDVDRKEVQGDAVPVTAGATTESLFLQVHAAWSQNGLIAYVPGGDLSLGNLTWVDRDGRVAPLDTPPQIYGAVDLAPDGKRLAVHVADVKDYVWIYDIERRVGRRLPNANPYGWPRWSPDGRGLAVHIPPTTKEPRAVFLLDPDDNADTGRKVDSPFPGAGLQAWSRDDVLALVYARRANFVSLRNPIEAPALAGNFFSFSPDGRWLAYNSPQTGSGSEEVYIRSFLDGKDRQFSVDGGIESLWLDSGELYYRKGNRWMSSRVSTSPELGFDPPQPAFETEFIDTPGWSYDVSPNGERLLVVKRTEQIANSRINLIVNWQQSIKSAN